MLGFGVFRRKPRQFEYRPRYYDPEQEAREQRRRELFGDPADEEHKEDYKPGEYIRRDMLARRGIGQRGRRTKKPSAMMAVFALLCLFALLLWIFLT